ncbi:MAG: hypothetical protein EPO55_05500 [Reyranella sp.]|uniref:hypothetical protein n=1 Tax=Reyranella sp. TaxID=1929291 RepID=UPI00120F35A8|nr:hypothetical protein [Reyranella sp.]TAJ41530.1 MAG: hypothetical protein EPO55_05500 [Reyranella sp.]
MFSAAEIARGVQGALAFLWRDPRAPSYFDNTTEACLRSFRLMLLVAPLHIILLLVRYSDVTVTADEMEIFVVETFSYVVEWLLFPVVFHEIARRQGWLDRYARYIGALNWINLPGMALAAVFVPLAHLAPNAIGDLVSIILQGLFFYWFLVTTRQVLGGGWLLSAMLLIVSWVPLAFISFLVARYLGVVAVAGA